MRFDENEGSRVEQSGVCDVGDEKNTSSSHKKNGCGTSHN
jgi:hypothetical protein